MNATFIFTVFYGDLERDIGKDGLEQLQKNIVFLFNRDDALMLNED